jgi:hypothetical protein
MSGREIGNRHAADTAAKPGRKPPRRSVPQATRSIDGVGMRLNTIQFPTA